MWAANMYEPIIYDVLSNNELLYCLFQYLKYYFSCAVIFIKYFNPNKIVDNVLADCTLFNSSIFRLANSFANFAVASD